MKKDGTPLWVNVTSTFVPATGSSPPMLQGIYINIDDRKTRRAGPAGQRGAFDLTHEDDRSATKDLVRSLLDGQLLA